MADSTDEEIQRYTRGYVMSPFCILTRARLGCLRCHLPPMSIQSGTTIVGYCPMLGGRHSTTSMDVRFRLRVRPRCCHNHRLRSSLLRMSSLSRAVSMRLGYTRRVLCRHHQYPYMGQRCHIIERLVVAGLILSLTLGLCLLHPSSVHPRQSRQSLGVSIDRILPSGYAATLMLV